MESVVLNIALTLRAVLENARRNAALDAFILDLGEDECFGSTSHELLAINLSKIVTRRKS